MAKVAILLSAYNGGRYIEEQLESIYHQTYKDFQLYIRDDGSEKEFVELLEKMKKKYGFVLYEGNNLGFVGSFMWLLRNVKDAEYYTFADQDDIWKEKKLEKAVEWFEEGLAGGVIKEKRPVLFHSAYAVMDSNGTVIDHFWFPDEGYDFRRSVTENHYSGFSMMINRSLRRFMIAGNDSEIGYHDWWAAMIVQAFGTAHSSDEVLAVHRAHGDNITTFNIFTRFRWLHATWREESEIHKRALEFHKCFGRRLKKKDRILLELFCDERYNLDHALKKSFYPARWRPVLSSEIVVRLLMLFGRI